jgi:hypothetical protein
LFWSADSRYIGFVSRDRLKKVAVSGGPVQDLCGVPNLVNLFTVSGTWNQDDVILLSGGVERPGLLRVSAAGCQPIPETKPDYASRKENAHIAPHFLPDGRHYLYVAVVGDSRFPRLLALRAYVGTLDSQERHPLPGIESEVKYVPSGHLIFIRAGALMAQAFDLRRLEVTGDAFPITDRLFDSTQVPMATDLFSVSTNGTLAYRAPSPPELAQHPLFRTNTPPSQLTLFDRGGNPVRDVGPKDEYASVRLSHDGKYVAFVRDGGIWVMDMEKGLATPFTTHPAPAGRPVWSWDDHRMAFTTTGAFYEQPFGVVGDGKPVLQSQAAWLITDWSRDGYLIFSDNPYPAAPHVDIWALPPGDSKEPFHVTNKPFAQWAARVSPDGRWIAYLSDEPRRKLDGTGTMQRPDIYVQPFPQAGVPPQRITMDGGYMPRWSRDGKELFYVAPDSNTMSVPIRVAGSSFEAGAPMRLFKAPLDPAFLSIGEVAPGTGYDVDPNGRFLINVSDSMATRKASDPKTQANSISVILNWATTLHK